MDSTALLAPAAPAAFDARVAAAERIVKCP